MTNKFMQRLVNHLKEKSHPGYFRGNLGFSHYQKHDSFSPILNGVVNKEITQVVW